MAQVSQYVFYTMRAAKAKLEGKPAYDRFIELARDRSSIPPVRGDLIGSFAPQCNARFPRSAVAILPPAGLSRDATCLAVVSFLSDQLRDADMSFSDPKRNLQHWMTYSAPRPGSQELLKAGIKSRADVDIYMHERFATAVEQNDPGAVATACGVVGL